MSRKHIIMFVAFVLSAMTSSPSLGSDQAVCGVGSHLAACNTPICELYLGTPTRLIPYVNFYPDSVHQRVDPSYIVAKGRISKMTVNEKLDCMAAGIGQVLATYAIFQQTMKELEKLSERSGKGHKMKQFPTKPMPSGNAVGR